MATIKEHYRNIAEQHDHLWSYANQYTGEFYDSLAKICSGLSDRDHSTLVDIGCGTGKFLRQFSSVVPFSKLIAVEPCLEFLDQLIESDFPKKVVEKYNNTGNEFVRLGVHFDCVTIIAAIHHIPLDELQEFFDNLYKQLRPGGRFIIIGRLRSAPPYPFWPTLREAWAEQVAAFLPNILVKRLEEAGFHVSLEDIPFPVILTREKWSEMLMGRFCSTITQFTDKEVEEGIAEMNYPEYVEFDDTISFVIAEKPGGFCQPQASLKNTAGDTAPK
jgi:SAM-dependent methyltransferase